MRKGDFLRLINKAGEPAQHEIAHLRQEIPVQQRLGMAGIAVFHFAGIQVDGTQQQGAEQTVTPVVKNKFVQGRGDLCRLLSPLESRLHEAAHHKHQERGFHAFPRYVPHHEIQLVVLQTAAIHLYL